MLITKSRQDESDAWKTPHQRRYNRLPDAADVYPFGCKVYWYNTKEERDQHAKHSGIGYYLHPTKSTPTSHDLYSPSKGSIVSRSDELISVIYEIFYGMEMGKAFEERLKTQRYARQLSEESSRMLQQTYGERDLLHRMLQASLTNKLMLDTNAANGQEMTEGVYQRVMEKAIDQEIANQKEAMGREFQRKRTESKQSAGSAAEVANEGVLEGEAPRRGSRERKQAHSDDPNRVWLQSWNKKVSTDSEGKVQEPLQPAPSTELFMEAMETMLMKTDADCEDLINRIGEEFNMDVALMKLQADHWHNRSDDNYTTLTEAVTRVQGEGDAALEAALEETDFMYGKLDGTVRVRVHSARKLLETKRLKRKQDILKAPKVVFKKKYKPDPADPVKKLFDRLRVRLTAPGHLSRKFIHFDPNRTMAPVMNQCTFILILILAVLYDLDLFQTDDSKAFYFGHTDFEYFTWVPEVIRDMIEYAPYGPDDTVWEPLTSWYGTKGAAQEYYTATANHVTNPDGMQMMKSERDPSFFIRWFDTKNMLFFGMHVDDKLGATTKLEALFKRWFLPQMNERFITNPDYNINYALGCNIHYDKARGVLTLSNETAISTFLKDNHLEQLSPRSTPCSRELAKRIEQEPMPSTQEELDVADKLKPAYWKYLGWAAHIARMSVPWAITACGIAAKFMANPSPVHFELVIYIIAHLAYVVKKKIWRKFSRPKGFDPKKSTIWMIFMVDSDHRGNKSGTSNSGLAVFICNNFLHGSRKPQKCITLNTCESEFVSMSTGSQFAIWLVLMIQEALFPIDYPCAIVGDNTAAISVAHSPGTAKYARHIDLRSKFVCRVAKKRDFVIAYINTHSNVSDAFTKIVEPKAFLRFMMWMANGLDDQFDGEIVATLEQLFQECKMRDMAARMKEKRDEQQRIDASKQLGLTSGGVVPNSNPDAVIGTNLDNPDTSQSDHDAQDSTSKSHCANGTKRKGTVAATKKVSFDTRQKIKVKRSRWRR
jgi:hypothetical protein